MALKVAFPPFGAMLLGATFWDRFDGRFSGTDFLIGVILCSKDDSSSSEDPPRVNMPLLLGGSKFCDARLDEARDTRPWLKRLCDDRNEEAAGLKPCTTLPERINPSPSVEETLVSESLCSDCLAVLMVVAVVVDIQDDSVENGRRWLERDSGLSCRVARGSSGCIFAFTTASMRGDKGPNSLFS